MKLLLIALLVGLSSFSVNARLADAADRLPTYTNIDGNVPTHRYADGKAEEVFQNPSTDTVDVQRWNYSHPDAAGHWYDFISILRAVIIVIYGYIWVTRVNPHFLKTTGEIDWLLWDTPFLKKFSIVCCIVGAILGFMIGFASNGPTINTFGDHLALGLLGWAHGNLC